ncbi:MAG: hypothetical protein H8E15_14355 [Planctomycetes bacterium]|nr:hypothetical protein [Planctomycetota bacterium]
MTDPCTQNLATYFDIAASFENGDRGQMHAAALALAAAESAECVHEVLRFLHLFYGFPRLVRAWNALPESLRAGPQASKATSMPTLAPSSASGLAGFENLYQDRATTVLEHLRQLDGLSTQWILEHAYAQVMSRPHLATPVQERLAALALASTHCWQQWRSHVDIAIRLGVSVETLRQDLLVTNWPDAATRDRALELLA